MTIQLLEWKDEYSLGIAEVDFEHRELIRLINDMLVQLDESSPGADTLYFLGEIHARISSHFALEEKIMRELRYKHYAEHKADHDRLLNEIRDIMDECEDSAAFNREKFIGRLNHWFTDHFRTKDAQFHKHLDTG